MNHKIIKTSWLFLFSLLLFFPLFSSQAFTETKTSEIATSKIGDFIPSGDKSDATVEDIAKYFSVSQARIDEINSCNTKKTEANSYYNNFTERNKCQAILNYQGQGSGYSDSFGNWVTFKTAPTEAEKKSCEEKEDLVKKYTTFSVFADEYGFSYGELPAYYDYSCGCINCAKGTLSAASLGLVNTKYQYIDESKIQSFFGGYNSGGNGLRAWMEGPSKFCVRREVPYWYHINCYNFTAESGYRLSCGQSNTYNYSFDYQTKKLGEFDWSGFDPSKNVYKCQDIKVVFSSIGDFSANLQKNPETGGKIDFFNYKNYSVPHTPPTDILECLDQNSCLSQAKEYEVAPGTGNFAKGVMQVPSEFKSQVEKSIESIDNPSLICKDGICKTTKVGKFTIKSKAPEVNYFGQCRNGENLVNTDLVKMAAAESKAEFNVINRAPKISISLSKNNINLNEEIKATCDISDPDACSDKIARVKWLCYNEKKEKVACYFGKNGIWREGEVTEEIPEEKRSSEYRSEVLWKAGVKGIYALACEASDDDVSAQAIGRGISPITVGDCGKDGVCNQNCNPKDPDCDELPQKLKYCSILFENGSINQTICGSKASSNLSAYKADTVSDQEVEKYEWDCKNGEGLKTTNSPNQTCNYEKEGIYIPSLKIYYKDGSEPTECVSGNNSIKVTNKAKCLILAKPEGSTDDYKSGVKVGIDQPIEVRLEGSCFDAEKKTEWLSDGEKVGLTKNFQATFKYKTAGFGFIKAKIGGLECEGVNVTIDEEIKWGN